MLRLYLACSRGSEPKKVILAPAITALTDKALLGLIQQLRTQGERVVFSLHADDAQAAQRHIVSENSQWLVKSIS